MHPIWPLFDLRVTTPNLELRTIDDELAVELSQLAAGGVHDPAVMPFLVEWTDVESPQLERNTMQYYWRVRAAWTPASWNQQFAVIEGSTVVGTTSLMADRFADLRTFETGSWLGQAHQGRGIGKEMRVASLQLGFAGLHASIATTAAFADNERSLGVTRRLGYEQNGIDARLRRGVPAETIRFRMDRARWETAVRRDDIEIHGLDGCREMFGIA